MFSEAVQNDRSQDNTKTTGTFRNRDAPENGLFWLKPLVPGVGLQRGAFTRFDGPHRVGASYYLMGGNLPASATAGQRLPVTAGDSSG